ncbi:MAG: 2-iminoacetate synthase ThiH [Gracilibacteraceae bacterium]|jgi:2-iminoacetate synthase|nr:2-iminoacetate synthase ThiH [Gracilibacteraceae bacterium]
MAEVLAAARAADFASFTAADARAALERETLRPADLAALLSPAALSLLEDMARRARAATIKYFGNAVALFTPLYIANYCENECVYCGFNCRNKIRRGRLSPEEMAAEMENIASTGLKEILLLTGESRRQSGVDYIGAAVAMARRYFTVGVEIYPLDTAEYAYLHEQGADFVSVYQETYDPEIYAAVHRRGPKRAYAYRFQAQERALRGGMRGVAVGALLGLGDYRRDALAAGLHAFLLQKHYPHAEISFSVPRLRPYARDTLKEGRAVFGHPAGRGVGERELLQVMLAFRLFMPFAGITISTRERAGFRDHVLGLCATKISAGVTVGVGGRALAEKGDGQFEISDPRGVGAMRAAIRARGLQPVFRDHLYV